MIPIMELQTKTTWRDGSVALEVKEQAGFGARYTIFVGPGGVHDTRLELSEANWQSVLALISACTKAMA